MRVLLIVAATLAFAPSASATLTSCPDFDHGGYHVRGLREQGLGCHYAAGLARHYVEHGTAGDLSCSRSFLPHNVTEVSCSKVKHGEKLGIQFGIQPIARAGAAAHAASTILTPCQNIVYHGYGARGIRQRGVGCDIAHGLVRHVIDHANSHFSHWRCSFEYLPRNVTHWTCRGVGHDAEVSFGLILQPGRNPTH